MAQAMAVDLELRLGPPGSYGHLLSPPSRMGDRVVTCLDLVLYVGPPEESAAVQEPGKRTRDQEAGENAMEVVVKRVRSEEPLPVQPLRVLPPGLAPASAVKRKRVVRREPRNGKARAAQNKDEGGDTEPAWVRTELFPRLGLPGDLPLHFVLEKDVQPSDMNKQQSRFLVTSSAADRLRALLFEEERAAASLVSADRRRPQPVELPEQQQEEQDGSNKKNEGRKHHGLPVLVCERGGHVSELQLTKWDSTKATVIKGPGYMDVAARSSFKEGDRVELWLFRRPPHLQVLDAGEPLYLVLAKKADERRALNPPAGRTNRSIASHLS